MSFFRRKELDYEKFIEDNIRDSKKDDILKKELSNEELQDYEEACWISTQYIISLEDHERDWKDDHTRKILVKEFQKKMKQIVKEYPY